jgi:hypothetical protein
MSRIASKVGIALTLAITAVSAAGCSPSYSLISF